MSLFKWLTKWRVDKTPSWRNVVAPNSSKLLFFFTRFSEILFSPDADEGKDVADLLHEDDGRVVQPDDATTLVSNGI
jgi:hypothetical protein